MDTVNDDLPEAGDVTYKLSDDGKKVQRISGKKVDIYDFSEFREIVPFRENVTPSPSSKDC